VPLVLSRATTGIVTTVVVGILIAFAMRRGVGASSALAAAGTVGAATPSGRADPQSASSHTHAGAHEVSVTARRAWILAIGCGVADAAANALMLLALRAGDLAVVSALTALYPAGTILLAAVVLRERVAAVQWVGLALALAAGGMLAVA
jgi:drug/metabolite transporter (DMT)-like permease